MGNCRRCWHASLLIVWGLVLGVVPVQAQLDFGPETLIQAGDADITVPGYSVPSLVDFDNDGQQDLIVGEGSGFYPAKVRLYLNSGSASNPEFTTFSHIQAGGVVLTCTGSGCMGCFPRVVQWDGDGKKDFLVGHSVGTIMVYLNIGTDASPVFDDGRYLQVGPAGGKVNINVGGRPALTVADWDNDGRKDLVVGAKDGTVRLFINAGTDAAPDFLAESRVQMGTSNLIVPTTRASVVVDELTGDGKKDLLAGNTEGQVLLYTNVGTDASPSFIAYKYVTSEGAAIDLPGVPRARPSVCDWNEDGLKDLLIGAGDGTVHLYMGMAPSPCADFDDDGHVDPDDGNYFLSCHTGANVPQSDPACASADLDGDGDVDQDDFGLMQRCFGGPNDAPNPECECE